MVLGINGSFHPLRIMGWLVVSNIFGIFTPKIGEDEPMLTCAYFSKGLLQPPTRKCLGTFAKVDDNCLG